VRTWSSGCAEGARERQRLSRRIVRDPRTERVRRQTERSAFREDRRFLENPVQPQRFFHASRFVKDGESVLNSRRDKEAAELARERDPDCVPVEGHRAPRGQKKRAGYRHAWVQLERRCRDTSRVCRDERLPIRKAADRVRPSIRLWREAPYVGRRVPGQFVEPRRPAGIEARCRPETTVRRPEDTIPPVSVGRFELLR
jgi:hypothetical protein